MLLPGTITVFLSSTRAYESQARKIKKQLKKQRFDVWYYLDHGKKRTSDVKEELQIVISRADIAICLLGTDFGYSVNQEKTLDDNPFVFDLLHLTKSGIRKLFPPPKTSWSWVMWEMYQVTLHGLKNKYFVTRNYLRKEPQTEQEKQQRAFIARVCGTDKVVWDWIDASSLPDQASEYVSEISKALPEYTAQRIAGRARLNTLINVIGLIAIAITLVVAITSLLRSFQAAYALLYLLLITAVGTVILIANHMRRLI